ncbi:mirror-image polydactyly gene 1 protein [Pitangus sulphuratus]|nr:mirror-image polydactyly gene 1 protein [Pitangus sulphuratus]
MLEQFVKNCSLWEVIMLKFMEDPMLEQGKSVRSPPPMEEVAETRCLFWSLPKALYTFANLLSISASILPSEEMMLPRSLDLTLLYGKISLQEDLDYLLPCLKNLLCCAAPHDDVINELATVINGFSEVVPKNSQKTPEFFIQTDPEAPKPSDLPVKSQRGGVLNDYSSGPEESSAVERKANRMLPEFIPSWEDSSDLGGRTETAFLLKELDTLRAKNKKLQDNLVEKDKELKTMKLDLELQEKATEAKIAEKIAGLKADRIGLVDVPLEDVSKKNFVVLTRAVALVEEVYSAQRERDEAVMARLRLANEERDEAFLRVQRLEESLKELENINPEENDMTLQELLNRINNADTGIDILKNGAIILNRIHRTKERKKKIIAEEMNAVIEQRDAALSQCKRLEQELHHLKEQNQTSANNTRHLTAENNQERALKSSYSLENRPSGTDESCFSDSLRNGFVSALGLAAAELPEEEISSQSPLTVSSKAIATDSNSPHSYPYFWRGENNLYNPTVGNVPSQAQWKERELQLSGL